MTLSQRLLHILRSEAKGLGDRFEDWLRSAERRADERRADERRTGGRDEKRGRAGGSASNGSTSNRGASTGHRSPGQDPDLARWYANLEVPYGSDLATVKRAYRRLAAQYHPDRHASDPEKSRIANELLQGLNHAYNELSRHLADRA
ncbi:MAG: J domain-containing protein [Acidobacteriota bacterium]